MSKYIYVVNVVGELVKNFVNMDSLILHFPSKSNTKTHLVYVYSSLCFRSILAIPNSNEETMMSRRTGKYLYTRIQEALKNQDYNILSSTEFYKKLNIPCEVRIIMDIPIYNKLL